MNTSAEEPNTHEAQIVIKRYRDGYRVASALTGIGGLAKGVSILVLIIGAGITVSVEGPVRLIAPFAGLCVTFILYVLGTLVAAHGQGIMAQLDSAVHSSPFLTDGQRALAMSL